LSSLPALRPAPPLSLASARLNASNLLSVWNVAPALGRTFRPEEGQPGAANVALLTRAFWQRRFDAAPSALERQLALNGESYAVIGVLPEALGKGLFVGTDIVIPAVWKPRPRAERLRCLRTRSQ
jgi:hypothetical protein